MAGPFERGEALARSRRKLLERECLHAFPFRPAGISERPASEPRVPRICRWRPAPRKERRSMSCFSSAVAVFVRRRGAVEGCRRPRAPGCTRLAAALPCCRARRPRRHGVGLGERTASGESVSHTAPAAPAEVRRRARSGPRRDARGPFEAPRPTSAMRPPRKLLEIHVEEDVAHGRLRPERTASSVPAIRSSESLRSGSGRSRRGRGRLEEIKCLDLSGDLHLEIRRHESEDWPVLPVHGEDVQSQNLDLFRRDAHAALPLLFLCRLVLRGGRRRAQQQDGGRRGRATSFREDGAEHRDVCSRERAGAPRSLSSSSGANVLGNLQRPGLAQVFLDDEVEEHLAHAVLSAVLEHAWHLPRLELDARHRLEVLAEHGGPGTERDEEDEKEDARERKEDQPLVSPRTSKRDDGFIAPSRPGRLAGRISDSLKVQSA